MKIEKSVIMQTAEPENKSSVLDFIESIGEFLFGLTIISLVIAGPSLLAWVIFTFCLNLSPEFAIDLTLLVSGIWITHLIIYILYNTRGGDLEC